jgi:hypothetical protein
MQKCHSFHALWLIGGTQLLLKYAWLSWLRRQNRHSRYFMPIRADNQ